MKKKFPTSAVVAGSIAFDRRKIHQFETLGVCSEKGLVVDKEFNWHRLSDCSFIRAGTISVTEAKIRTQQFPNVKWDDGDVRMKPIRRQRSPLRVMVA